MHGSHIYFYYRLLCEASSPCEFNDAPEVPPILPSIEANPPLIEVEPPEEQKI